MKSKKGMQSKGSETKRIKNGNYLGRRKRNHNTGKERQPNELEKEAKKKRRGKKKAMRN